MKIKWANWEELPQGRLRSFAKSFVENNSAELILNVETKFKILKISTDIYFPVTINNTEWDNSYVCSPFTSYVLYAKDELLRKVKNRIIQYPLLLIIIIIAKWLKFGQINKNVHVNNFLISTNPYPDWNGEGIPEITEFLKKHYPDHAIIFRSLNQYQHQHLLNSFADGQYQMIASRQVYIFNLTQAEWSKRRINKKDTKLIRKQNLVFLEHEEMGEYLEQALQLYQKLYLIKYSQYNPQFTIDFFKMCYSQKIICFQGYRDGNHALKSFSGFFILYDTMYTPLIGYDTEAPQKEGLYIHAAQLSILHKFKTGLLLNKSSGASHFKKIRGCEPSTEYSVVYTKHLKRNRRITWKTLQFTSNRIGLPIIKNHEL